MTECVAETLGPATEVETHEVEVGRGAGWTDRQLGETVFDPLTGELIEVEDRGRLLDLHDRLEGVALEILTACRDIRNALVGTSVSERRTLGLFVPPEERTIPMARSLRYAQGDEFQRA